jgi:hypothetical protein
MSSDSVLERYGVPPELLLVLGASFQPKAVWLTGIRTIGEHAPDVPWDIVVVVDDARRHLTDRIVSWDACEALSELGIPVKLVVVTEAHLASLWNVANTIGRDLARRGVRLDVPVV